MIYKFITKRTTCSHIRLLWGNGPVSHVKYLRFVCPLQHISSSCDLFIALESTNMSNSVKADLLEGCISITHVRWIKMVITWQTVKMSLLWLFLPPPPLLTSSSETAWSPQCAVEKIRLERMMPALSPKPRLHLSLPARWLLLDPSLLLHQLHLSRSRPGTHRRQAANAFNGPILLTYLSNCPRCSWHNCNHGGTNSVRSQHLHFQSI